MVLFTTININHVSRQQRAEIGQRSNNDVQLSTWCGARVDRVLAKSVSSVSDDWVMIPLRGSRDLLMAKNDGLGEFLVGHHIILEWRIGSQLSDEWVKVPSRGSRPFDGKEGQFGQIPCRTVCSSSSPARTQPRVRSESVTEAIRRMELERRRQKGNDAGGRYEGAIAEDDEKGWGGRHTGGRREGQWLHGRTTGERW
jgi:hypothetical protein